MPLFSLASWAANARHRQPCIRVLPQQTSREEKKPRGAFSRRPSASTTPPRVPSTQFIFLPIKVSPPAWLWETQFMRRALGVLLLAGTEQGSQRGGGPGSRTSRSLVSRRQRRAGTGSPRADRKSGAPPPRPRPPRGRHGPWGARGLQPRRADRGNGADPGLDPQAEQWHLLRTLGQRWGSPWRGAWSHPLPAGHSTAQLKNWEAQWVEG